MCEETVQTAVLYKYDEFGLVLDKYLHLLKSTRDNQTVFRYIIFMVNIVIPDMTIQQFSLKETYV